MKPILEEAMAARFILSDYIDGAMSIAEFDKLDGGSYAGRIPVCQGVVAFGETLTKCQEELRSTLEDWALVGIKLGHPIPPIDGIDLTPEPVRELVDAL